MNNVFDKIRLEIEALQLMVENCDAFRYDFNMSTPFGDVDLPEKESLLAICHIAIGYKQRHLAKLQDMAARDSLITKLKMEASNGMRRVNHIRKVTKMVESEGE